MKDLSMTAQAHKTRIVRSGKSLPVIITSGSTLSAVDAEDCDGCVWSDSKDCGIGWGGNKCGDINGPAG